MGSQTRSRPFATREALEHAESQSPSHNCRCSRRPKQGQLCLSSQAHTQLAAGRRGEAATKAQ